MKNLFDAAVANQVKTRLGNCSPTRKALGQDDRGADAGALLG